MEPATQQLQPGQIRDANRAMLVAACQLAAAEVVDLGIARDTEGHVEACLERAIKQQVDVLITTGDRLVGGFMADMIALPHSCLYCPELSAIHRVQSCAVAALRQWPPICAHNLDCRLATMHL